MGKTTDADVGVPATTADDVLSVRQLNERISDRLDASDELQSVRCLGEVTNLSQSNAAVYFSLTDGECVLPCMLWQNRYQNMDIDLEDDQEVVLEGGIDYWVEGGRVSLKPWQVTVVGDGDQAAVLERLRAELDARGWFDEQHKTDPPRFPDRIGIVTSLNGDARYDIQNAIHSRNPAVDLVVKHAAVQGDHAPASLANSIYYLDRNDKVDTIVVGRGGGSDSDLMAFNTKAVAEAIFTAQTPVVAAVGHTEDQTIAGRVADVDAITPTDAGDYAVASVEQFLSGEVATLEQQLDAAYELFEQELEHEQELEEAATEAGGTAGLSPVYYKAIIAVLLVLLVLVLGLWLIQ